MQHRHGRCDLSHQPQRKARDQIFIYIIIYKICFQHAVGNVILSKYTWCLTSTETIRLIRDGEGEGKGGRKSEVIYLSLHCHHQNDSCVKMGSNESRFNVSLIVRNSHKTVSTDHNF